MKHVFEKMFKGPQFKKYILITVAIVLAVCAVFIFFYIYDSAGDIFTFGGESFRLDKVSSKQITLRNADGDELIFTRDGTISVTVEYERGVVRYGGGYSGLTGSGYSFSDGTDTAGLPYASSDLTDLQRQEVRLLTELRDYSYNVSLKYRYPFHYAIMLLMVIAIVFASMRPIIYTEESWENSLLRKLFVHGGEPTDFALFAYKAAGVAAIAVTVLMFLSLITK